MKFRFLGTGTSQGVPMIGCECSVCASTDPRNRRFRSHAHLEVAGLNIQIDAAQEFRLQAIEYRIPKVDYAFLTHGHADHILGFDDMRAYCAQRDGEAIPVYSNRDGVERMRSIYPYAIRDRAAVRGYPAFRLEEMPSELDLPGVAIRSTKLSHGSFETLGLVFEEKASGRRLAYYTDCDSVGPEARALAAGADILVVDGLRFEPHRSHMTIDQAVETAQAIGAKQSYLIHMTHHVDHGSTEATLPNGVRLAYDGLLLDLS